MRSALMEPFLEKWFRGRWYVLWSDQPTVSTEVGQLSGGYEAVPKKKCGACFGSSTSKFKSTYRD